MTTSPVTSSVRRYASAAAAQREQRRGWLPGDRQRHPDGLPASTPGFSGESIGALDSADLHAAVHHQSDHPQQADDGDDEKQGVGASYSVHVMPPARTHGSAHRADLAARPLPAGTATADSPGPSGAVCPKARCGRCRSYWSRYSASTDRSCRQPKTSSSRPTVVRCANSIVAYELPTLIGPQPGPARA
jgi:hypothetical protein